MVQITATALSVAALASVAVQVSALPVNFEQNDIEAREIDGQNELVERGAFGRLGRILNPLLGGAGKAVMNGHAQANNFRRELEVEDDLAARGAFGRLGRILNPLLGGAGKAVMNGHSQASNFRRELGTEEEIFSREEFEDLVERGAFGRLGRILNPLLGGAGKAVMNGHAQANNFRRELDVEDEVLSREELEELVARGAFGRLGRILNPLLGGAGKAVMNGHAQANNFRRELDVEDEVFSREEFDELVERGAFGRLGRILNPLLGGAGKAVMNGHAQANNFRRELDIEDELNEILAREDFDELVERGAFGRLGRILNPLLGGAGKAVMNGHAQANNFRRDYDNELSERSLEDMD